MSLELLLIEGGEPAVVTEQSLALAMDRVLALLLEQPVGTSHVLEKRSVPGGAVRAVRTLPHLLFVYGVCVSVEIWKVVCDILAFLAVKDLVIRVFDLVVLNSSSFSLKFFATN